MGLELDLLDLAVDEEVGVKLLLRNRLRQIAEPKFPHSGVSSGFPLHLNHYCHWLIVFLTFLLAIGWLARSLLGWLLFTPGMWLLMIPIVALVMLIHLRSGWRLLLTFLWWRRGPPVSVSVTTSTSPLILLPLSVALLSLPFTVSILAVSFFASAPTSTCPPLLTHFLNLHFPFVLLYQQVLDFFAFFKRPFNHDNGHIQSVPFSLSDSDLCDFALTICSRKH